MSNSIQIRFQNLHPYLKKIILLLIVVSFFLPNTLLLIYGLIALILIINVTWPKGHLPIILVCLIFQWIQSITKIFQATLQNKSVNEFAGSAFASKAIFLSITAVVIVSIGFHVMIRNTDRYRSIFDDQNVYQEKKLFKLFLFLFFFSQLLLAISSFLPASLGQIILSLSYAQWVGYGILFIGTLKQKGNIKFLVIAFIMEMAINLFGYFSSFREVILYTAILCLPFLKRLNFAFLLVYSITFYIIFQFFIGWTGIKNDFRSNLNSSADLTYTQRASSFYELYSNFDDFEEAQEDGLDRLAYTDMLMYSLETVPNSKAHENGKLWLGAIQHIIMPRFLFPNKKILNDSEKANLYTGKEWAGAEEGTSISIGYIAESYVDFGSVIMFLPLFFIGLGVGFIYKKINHLKTSSIITFSLLATALFFTKLSLLETSGDKLIGAITMNFLILYCFGFYSSKKILNYISSDK